VTRHFSQFLFAPYGDGEGLRAVGDHAAEEALHGSVEPAGSVEEAPVVDATSPEAWPPLAAVEWPLTHRPFDDDDEPEVADGHFAAADEDPDAEAVEEAAAYAARAALLAEVYGWPHRAV
jgi:hypothetical protein